MASPGIRDALESATVNLTAWHAGAKEWRKARKQAHFYPVHAAENTQQPVESLGSGGQTPLPNQTQVVEHFQQEMARLVALEIHDREAEGGREMKTAIRFVGTAFLLTVMTGCQGAYLMDIMRGQVESMKAQTAKAMTAFSFPSPPATDTIDENANTISVTVPYGTNVPATYIAFATLCCRPR